MSSDGDPASRLSASKVRGRVFRPASPGTSGADPEEVGEFLTAVAQELALTLAERDEARQDIAKLRADIPEEAHTQAVTLLQRAQQNADKLIEDARRSAADLAREARASARELESAARTHADQLKTSAVREAATEAAMAAASAPATLRAELAALRTLGTVMRAHMHSYFESGLAALAEWEKQAGQAMAASDLGQVAGGKAG